MNKYSLLMKLKNIMKFTLTQDHLKLLKAACINWQDCEFGAPEINPKRPYGNSCCIEQDMAEILGMELFEDAEGEKHLSKEQDDYVCQIHRETETALQILLSKCTIALGEYELLDGYEYSDKPQKLINLIKQK